LKPVDLVVIGGGINGAGIARDAAGRGLSVILCEKDDLAQGTSSRSGKLIHGGLRYLEYYEFRLVREALIEREVLLNARRTSCGPCASCCRIRPSSGPPGWCGLACFSTITSAAARNCPAAATSTCARSGRKADQGRVHARLRIFRLLGG
jgi:D-erythritol 1-phosphate dehydrogenase